MDLASRVTSCDSRWSSSSCSRLPTPSTCDVRPRAARSAAICVPLTENCGAARVSGLQRSGYFEDDEFIAFLKYLTYFQRPQYAMLLTYAALGL